jgi:hypothetical protein
MAAHASRLRNLVLVLGDQLDRRSAAFDGFEQGADAVLMMEVVEEATYVPQHKIRLAASPGPPSAGTGARGSSAGPSPAARPA